MRLNPLQICKNALIIAAGAVVVMMVAIEVAVVIVAIQFFTIFAAY